MPSCTQYLLLAKYWATVVYVTLCTCMTPTSFIHFNSTTFLHVTMKTIYDDGELRTENEIEIYGEREGVGGKDEIPGGGGEMHCFKVFNKTVKLFCLWREEQL